MKRGDLSHWKNIPECTNLLLFSQLVNELLFDYSIPSNRISTLNSHYLCLDALNVIDSVENHGVPEGTLKPIMEELYSALKKDPIFSVSADSPLEYFVKYQADKYIPAGKVADMNYSDLIKTAKSISTCFFNENSYYESLKETIVDIVSKNNVCKQQDLFRLVKSLLTELMNSGYTLRYIYDVMNRNFWNPSTDIDSPLAIKVFFDSFGFCKKQYDVVFKVNRRRMEKFIACIDGLVFQDSIDARFRTHSEHQFLSRKNNECFICLKRKALDPFHAAESTKDMLSQNAALYRLYDHNYRYRIESVPCAVYDESAFYKVAQSIKAVEHTRAMSRKQISNSLNLADQAMESAVNNRAYYDFIAILNAVRLHSHSLDSISEENQLLDLWSIFESVLDISNKHTSDRIQQICMYLVPILKQNYIYSLFEQLASDIKNYDEQFLEELTGKNASSSEVVRKVCEFSLLSEYDQKRNEFILKCIDFPLLKERIEYYNLTLSNTDEVFKFVEKHSERVRWQVMRIYRNRNLIIHNGKSMPYLHLLIENLHSYVDDFLSYAIRSLSEGRDIESMCQELFVKECRWNAKFQKNKRPLDSNLIAQMLCI